MRRVSLKGVILGLLTTVLLDGILSIVGATVVVRSTVHPGMTHDEATAAVAALAVRPDILVGALIGGTLATIAGGYVTVRVAKRAPYLNAGVLGALGLLLGVPLAHNYPLWFNVVSFIVVPPAALLGGRLAVRRTEKSA